MVIFNSYVKLPEGNFSAPLNCHFAEVSAGPRKNAGHLVPGFQVTQLTAQLMSRPLEGGHQGQQAEAQLLVNSNLTTQRSNWWCSLNG